MKVFTSLSLIIVLMLFISCSNKPKQSSLQPEPPKALQDKQESSFEIVSKKRYEGDLVNALYEELVSKDPKLKDLEKRIESLYGKKNDSLLEYERFKVKNESYYSSANIHASGIQDSVLKTKIKAMIENSESKFNNKILGMQELKTKLAKNEVSINDAHIFLKIILTGPVMVKYQNENFPSSKPIESVTKESDDLLKKITVLLGN